MLQRIAIEGTDYDVCVLLENRMNWYVSVELMVGSNNYPIWQGQKQNIHFHLYNYPVLDKCVLVHNNTPDDLVQEVLSQLDLTLETLYEEYRRIHLAMLERKLSVYNELLEAAKKLY